MSARLSREYLLDLAIRNVTWLDCVDSHIPDYAPRWRKSLAEYPVEMWSRHPDMLPMVLKIRAEFRRLSSALSGLSSTATPISAN